MADAIPYFKPGDDYTGHCTAAVVGKHFVVVSAAAQADGVYSVATAGAGADAVGVAMRDGAVGDRIPITSEGIVPVVCGAVALVAGAAVQSDATGQAVVLAAGKKLGVVMTDAAIGADAQIKLSGM